MPTVHFFGTEVKINQVASIYPNRKPKQPPCRFYARPAPIFARQQEKRYIYMKKTMAVCAVMAAMCSCSAPQKMEVSRYTTEMNLVRQYHPDLYGEYMRGRVVIDDVYAVKGALNDSVGVCYHNVEFRPSPTRRHK